MIFAPKIMISSDVDISHLISNKHMPTDPPNPIPSFPLVIQLQDLIMLFANHPI